MPIFHESVQFYNPLCPYPEYNRSAPLDERCDMLFLSGDYSYSVCLFIHGVNGKQDICYAL